MVLLSCVQQTSIMMVNSKAFFSFKLNEYICKNTNAKVKQRKLLGEDWYILHKPQNIFVWVTKLRFSREGGSSPKYFRALYFANHKPDLLFSSAVLQPALLLNPLHNNLSGTWSNCRFFMLVGEITKEISCQSAACSEFWADSEQVTFSGNICGLMS